MAVLPLNSARSDEATLLASSVADLLRDRLASFAELTVISNLSAASLGAVANDVQAAGRKLHAQFVLHGNIERQGDRLQIALELTDTQTGRQLWADHFARPVGELAAVREETAAHVARVLHLPAGAPVPASPINLEAYQLYVRGQKLMSNLRQADAEQAAALFQRATVLDPGFARAYLASGQALLLINRTVTSEKHELEARVEKRYERALQLDPTLGEVWIERARLLQDKNRAEELYRKGLALSPNYGVGYMRYSELLMSQARGGEAIEMIDRARRVDPMTPHLHMRKAFMLFVQRSDVAGHEALLREALEINPDFQVALLLLAESRHMWSGEFAEAVSLAERAIALDPDDDLARTSAATMYLDLDDPQAAEHVLRGVRARADADVELAKYRRDVRRAAEIAYGLSDGDDWAAGPFSTLAEAICDAAAQSGDFARAIQLLESKYATGEGSIMRRRGVSVVYAVTLKLAGDAERSGRVARSLLAALNAEESAAQKNWFSRERAALFAVLGEDAKAMELLEVVQRMKQFARWWYTGELDPLYHALAFGPAIQGAGGAREATSRAAASAARGDAQQGCRATANWMNYRALIACVLATPALSAESPQSDEMETVVVTGSRIRGAADEHTAPVTEISHQELARGGNDSLGRALQSLPFNTGSAPNTNVNNGGDGSTRARPARPDAEAHARVAERTTPAERRRRRRLVRRHRLAAVVDGGARGSPDHRCVGRLRRGCHRRCRQRDHAQGCHRR